jgi:hypothetical protein
LNTDTQGVQIAWSETSNADDWSKNLIRARCEGRCATSVFQLLGVVQSHPTSTPASRINNYHHPQRYLIPDDGDEDEDDDANC